MKRDYDFADAVRGPVLRLPGKTRITIRIDDDILEWFLTQVHAAGGGNYQSLMNAALRDTMQRQSHGIEDALRLVIRQELVRYEVKKAPAAVQPASRPLTKDAKCSLRK